MVIHYSVKSTRPCWHMLSILIQYRVKSQVIENLELLHRQ